MNVNIDYTEKQKDQIIHLKSKKHLKLFGQMNPRLKFYQNDGKRKVRRGKGKEQL